MNYRILGRTNLRVSEIGLGALEIGRDWPYWRKNDQDFSKPDELSAIRLIHEAIELGINFVDTAPAYFQSETILGKALKGKRNEVVLATKCGEWFDGQSSQYDYSAAATQKFIENSLSQLQTDYVDVLQIHSGNLEVVQRGETFEAMKKAQKEGKVRFVGLSLDSEDVAVEALRNGGYDCLQVSYNVLSRGMEGVILPRAYDQGTGIIVKDGLAAGRLTPKFNELTDTSLKGHIGRIESMASGLDLSLPEFAIRFILSNRSVSTVILGTKRVEHLKANLRSAENSALTGMVREQVESLQS